MSKAEELTPIEEINILRKKAEQDFAEKDYIRSLKCLQEAVRTAYKLENSGDDEYATSFLTVLNQIKIIAEETKSKYLGEISQIVDDFEAKISEFGQQESKEAKIEAIHDGCIASADLITPYYFSLLKELLTPSNSKLIFAGVAIAAAAIAFTTYFIIKRRK